MFCALIICVIHSEKTFIVKPNAGAQGRGIFLTNSIKDIPVKEKTVVQEYLNSPLLIDGFKFDMRVYVLVASVNPLKIYLFKNGLVRLCTSKYERPTALNKADTFMHLTNYSINKSNDEFEFNNAEGVTLFFINSIHYDVAQ